MIVICTLLTFIVIPALIVWVILCLLYKSEIKDEKTISFKQYLLLSSMAPDKWHTSEILECVSYGDNYYNAQRIYMKTYIDKLKLSRYIHKGEEARKCKKKTKDMVKLISSWNKDIEEYRKKYGMEAVIEHQIKHDNKG